MASKGNQKLFNPQWIERLKYDRASAPPSGRIEIEDAGCPGLLLRVTPRGVKSFSVIYKVPGEGGVSAGGRRLVGKQHRVTLGVTPPLGLKEAREQAQELLRAASEGRDPREQRREHNLIRHTNTFEAVRKRFIDQEIKPSVKAWQNAERVLKLHVEPKWKDRPLSDIRRADVHELLDGLVQEGKVGTAREVRKHLSRLFNWAIDREIVTDSPVHGLTRGDLEPNEDAGRALSDTELRAIWQATGEMGYPFGPWYRLLMLTGRRREEWAAATRSEIDAEKRLHDLPKERHKSGRGHVVPLSDPAWAVFDSLPIWPGNDYHLFSTDGGTGHIKGFSKAKARLDTLALKLLKKDNPDATLANFRVHDFRVTCETRLAALGFSPDVFGAVLGHAKAGLQRTYNKHDYLAEKRAALDAFATHIMQVVK